MKKIILPCCLGLSVLCSSCGSTKPGGYLTAEKIKERHLKRSAKMKNTPRISNGRVETLDDIRERGRIANNKVAKTTNNPYIRHEKR